MPKTKSKHPSYAVTYIEKEGQPPHIVVLPTFPLAYNRFCKLPSCWWKELSEIETIEGEEDKRKIIEVNNVGSLKTVYFHNFCYVER